MEKTYTKDQMIGALRLVILEMLNAPVGNGRADFTKRQEILETANAAYVATAPQWQKDECLRLAQTLNANAPINTYADAIKAYGRSLLVSTERA